MIKILSCAQQKEADAYTIANEEISSVDLMEKAASMIAQEICGRWDQSNPIIVFAGAGNNGGDAIAVTRLLYQQNYHTELYLFNVTGNLSAECLTNIQRLQEIDFPDSCFHEIGKGQVKLPKLSEHDVVVDGLFGSGLHDPLSGGFASVVNYINASPCTVVSIDLPSGLMGEDNSKNLRKNIIRADLTLCIHQPKLSFFFPENEDIVGEWKVLDIGISKEFTEQTETPYAVTEAEDVKAMLKKRSKFAHKGNFGHGLLIAGSYGMAGASILAAKACLKSGAGLLTIHAPICNHQTLQTAVPEAIVHDDTSERYFSTLADLDDYQALAIGPGLGQEEESALATIDQLADCYIPVVLDADALNILSRNPSSLSKIPQGSILTPHIGELERLIGKCSNQFERLTKAKEMACELQCHIVLKGAYTTVITPEGNFYINPTGNPGMATAGSGDVLTGIILSLLTQGYTASEASRLGVYVHGLAGDIAAQRQGEISMTATDIIDALPEAWKTTSKTN